MMHADGGAADFQPHAVKADDEEAHVLGAVFLGTRHGAGDGIDDDKAVVAAVLLADRADGVDERLDLGRVHDVDGDREQPERSGLAFDAMVSAPCLDALGEADSTFACDVEHAAGARALALPWSAVGDAEREIEGGKALEGAGRAIEHGKATFDEPAVDEKLWRPERGERVEIERLENARLRRHGLRQMPAHVEAFRDGVCSVPALRDAGWGRGDGDGCGKRAQMAGYGLRIVGAGRVGIRPDDDMLAGKRCPVGLVDRRFRAAHGGRGRDALVDQRLCGLFSLDKNDMRFLGNAGAVVERTNGWHGGLGRSGVPWSELLGAVGEVVTAHGRKDAAGLVGVVPGARRGAEFILHFRSLWPCRLFERIAQPLLELLAGFGEVPASSDALPEADQVAGPLARREIVPEPFLAAG